MNWFTFPRFSIPFVQLMSQKGGHMKRRVLVLLVVALILLPLQVGVAVAAGPPTAEELLGQVAQSQELAQSAATAQQLGVPNANLPVRVLSPGDNTSAAQANNSSASSSASVARLSPDRVVAPAAATAMARGSRPHRWAMP